jgi:hypothetical protein
MESEVGPRADGLLDFEVVHLGGAGTGDLKWTPFFTNCAGNGGIII